MESRLLRFETFSQSSLVRTLEEDSLQHVSVCDTDAQRAMLLIEMPMAEAALRSGVSRQFDQHVQSLETRSRQMLGCAPRDSFAWLVLFNLSLLHGQLDEQSFKLLARSYQTAPNEAWISIRRITVAMPVVFLVAEPLRKAILFEFQQLIRNGFVENAARSYSSSSPTIRSALDVRIEQLDASQQKAFSEALRKLRL
jgi:hypothetical protein